MDALQNSAGVDSTEAYEYAGHSAENTKNLQQFLVGKLKGAKPSPSVSLLPTVTKQKVKIASSSLKLFTVLLSLGLVGLVAVAYTLWGGQKMATRKLEVKEKDKIGGE
jgi:cytochrome b involved in lipid metabolism